MNNEDVEGKKKIIDQIQHQYVIDITQNTIFDEVYKIQMKIIEDREKEVKQKKQEEINQKQQEHQEKLLQEEKKKAEANQKNAMYQEDFLKLQEECNVKEVSDLVAYYSEQLSQKTELKSIVEMV